MSRFHGWLEFTDSLTGALRRADLDFGRISVGRTGGDVLISDPDVAEIHCIITHEADTFMLRDLGSQGGTVVNGKSIIEVQLANNDKIQIGSTEIRFRMAHAEDNQAIAARLKVVRPDGEHNAPGHLHFAETVTQRGPVFPPSALSHPVRFWSQALQCGIFSARSLLVHALNFGLLAAIAYVLGKTGFLPQLGLLTLASLLSLIFIGMTCSVFFAFDSLPNAMHRLIQSLRFAFYLMPMLLSIQGAFLIWASSAQPQPGLYFVAAMVPTIFIWILVGAQSHYAFSASFIRAAAFAVTASVPWNLFMTGLLSFIV